MFEIYPIKLYKNKQYNKDIKNICYIIFYVVLFFIIVWYITYKGF